MGGDVIALRGWQQLSEVAAAAGEGGRRRGEWQVPAAPETGFRALRVPAGRARHPSPPLPLLLPLLLLREVVAAAPRAAPSSSPGRLLLRGYGSLGTAMGPRLQTPSPAQDPAARAWRAAAVM